MCLLHDIARDMTKKALAKARIEAEEAEERLQAIVANMPASKRRSTGGTGFKSALMWDPADGVAAARSPLPLSPAQRSDLDKFNGHANGWKREDISLHRLARIKQALKKYPTCAEAKQTWKVSGSGKVLPKSPLLFPMQSCKKYHCNLGECNESLCAFSHRCPVCLEIHPFHLFH